MAFNRELSQFAAYLSLDAAANYIGITTAESTTNVGIGKTNPTSKLEVVGDAKVTGVVTATTFIGALTGNASSATALQTARDFQVTGDAASTAISFDGTANVGLAVTLANTTVTPGSYGSSTQIPTFTVDSKGRLTAAGTASVGAALTVAGDSGTETINFLNENLTIAGTAGIITTSAASNTVTLNLVDTGVSAGSYGSSTAIPTFTVDAKGRLTTAGTAAIGAALTVAGDSGTETINFLSENLTIAGGTNLTSSAASNAVTINLDDNISLTSVVASGVVTAAQFVTGASGSAIGINTNTISGPATITLDPAGVGDNTGTVVIAGNLQVDGTTTTINSTTVTVDDKNIQIADGAINDAAADGAGFTVTSGDGNKTFQFEATGDNFGSSENMNLASGKVYKINNVEVLSGTTLGANVVNSSLTSVGTLTNLNVGNVNSTGIVTASTGAVIDGVQIGINGANVIDTVSGNLTLNSAGGTTIIDDLVNIQNNLNVSGNVTIGGTTVTLTGQDVFITNKDIVLGYTTSTSPNDTTANHAGVAIASTEGTPLVNFDVSGINTLPSTYKQMMWFQNGTLGFSTDAFAFNYGVAIGTTNMASGMRLAVGTGITMSDTAIKATNFYGTLSGSVSGTATTATNLADAANITTGTINSARLSGTYNINVSGSATYATSAGIATYATSSGIATYATTAGVSTSVIGGIASVTQLSVSGVSTIANLSATNVNVTGLSTFAGITTVTGDTLFAKQLEVSSTSTFYNTITVGNDGFGVSLIHDGTDGALSNPTTGNLIIRNTSPFANNSILLKGGPGASESLASFNVNGSVELYYDNSKKFETTGAGVTVYGTTFTDQLSATNVNASGIVTAAQFVTGASGSAIGINTNTISGPSQITIDPAGVGDNTGLVVIKGDLQIDGTTTTVNSTTVTVDDKNILLASGAANDAAADGGGITVESGDGNKTWNWVDSTDSWTSSEHINVASGKVYKVNGTEVLSSNTLGSGVVNSSLTSVGTLTQLSVGNVNSTGIVTASGGFYGEVNAVAFDTNPNGVVVTGVATATSGFIGALTGNVTGNLTGNVTGDINSSGMSTVTNLTIGGYVSIGSTTGAMNQVLASVGTGVTWKNFADLLPQARTTQTNTATANQTAFSFTYNVNYLDVFVNGVKLASSEYVATNGSNITLNEGAFAGDVVEFVSYSTVGAGSGTVNSLNDLSDVTLASNAAGNVLAYTGSEWVNTSNLNVGIITATTLNGALTGNATGLSGTPNITVGVITCTSVTASGDIAAANFNSTSDVNLKENIRPIENASELVSKLEGVHFTWKESGAETCGVIAQQIEEHLPQLVHTGEDHKSVNYNGLVGVLLAAVKEQGAQIAALQAEIEELKK